MTVLALIALVAAADIAVTFVDPPVRPAPGLPAETRDAGTEPDPDASTGGASNIRFRIVRDPSDHGPLSKVVAGRIAALDVTWSEAAVVGTRGETEEFLRRLLALPRGSTHTYVPWAQMLGVPSVLASVRHAEGDTGSWRIWYSWPSIYFAYRDGRGTWWFGYWFALDELRLGTSPATR